MKNFLARHWYFSAMALTIAAGFYWSGLGKIIRDYHLLSAGIFLSFFVMGAELETASILAGKNNAKALIAGVTSSLILFPILGFMMAKIFASNQSQLFAGLCLLSVVPVTMLTAAVLTKAGGGNVAMSLLINIATNTLAVFTVPFTLKIMLSAGEGIIISAGKIMLKIFLMVVLPVILGMIIRLSATEKIARHKTKLSAFCKIIILFIIFNAVAGSAGQISENTALLTVTATIALGLHVAALAMNFSIGKLLKFDTPSVCAFTITASQKTLGLSFVIWSGFFSHLPLAMLPVICYHLIQSVADAYVAEMFAKKIKNCHFDRNPDLSG
ncbi:MAG: bile acid:sodium symporter [Anaerohalosphaeraceae bacterium]|nr:bile acid:sodium symporter [Anaerohalosphaeraceae bacterium]